MEIEGTSGSKNFDETVRLQSERREDHKELQRARVVLPVWPAHQPRRSPGETSVRAPIVAGWNRRENTFPPREIELEGQREEMGSGRLVGPTETSKERAE